MRYLDPKADLTFKRVFGEHPDIVISFLNALLPLEDDEQIVEIEYLSSEMIPENDLNKYSIVDVRCKDSLGRQFLVEMQTAWSSEFQQRVLFNSSKAYVRQLGKSKNYKLLKPVYSLNLIDAVFEPSLEGYYHHYKIVHVEHSEKVIDGLQLVFIELPKFKPQNLQEKKMRALWLRFLTEIDEQTREVSEELLAVPEVKKAVETLEEGAFSEAEMLGYDKFWDAVRCERTLMEGSREEGIEEGIEIGREEGAKRKQLEIARNSKAASIPYETICQITGLTLEEIEKC